MVPLDPAAVGEGDAHLPARARVGLLAGREHEEDRLHLGVRDGLGRSAALGLQRELRPAQVQVGNAAAPGAAGAGVDGDAVLAGNESPDRRPSAGSHGRRIVVERRRQIGMVVRVQPPHRLPVRDRLQRGIHHRLHRRIQILDRPQQQLRLVVLHGPRPLLRLVAQRGARGQRREHLPLFARPGGRGGLGHQLGAFPGRRRGPGAFVGHRARDRHEAGCARGLRRLPARGFLRRCGRPLIGGRGGLCGSGPFRRRLRGGHPRRRLRILPGFRLRSLGPGFGRRLRDWLHLRVGRRRHPGRRGTGVLHRLGPWSLGGLQRQELSPQPRLPHAVADRPRIGCLDADLHFRSIRGLRSRKGARTGSYPRGQRQAVRANRARQPLGPVASERIGGGSRGGFLGWKRLRRPGLCLEVGHGRARSGRNASIAETPGGPATCGIYTHRRTR